MPTVTHFTAGMFAATEHTKVQEKAEFANRLGSFIINGFRPGDFTNIIYSRLSQCFSHIAHYSREGFYGVWFSSQAKQDEFIKYTLEYKSRGNPKFTFTDVEQEFQTWLGEQDIQVKVEAKAVNERAYIALENTADHALTLLSADKTAETVGTVIDQCVAFITKFLPNVLDAERVEAIKAAMVHKYAADQLSKGGGKK